MWYGDSDHGVAFGSASTGSLVGGGLELCLNCGAGWGTRHLACGLSFLPFTKVVHLYIFPQKTLHFLKVYF